MTMPVWRECDGCRIKMPSYMPRRRVGDQMLCDTCAKPKQVTASWSQARHPSPIVHVIGRRPPRPLQTGDTLMHPETGYSTPIIGHSESLLMTEGSGIQHRGPVEGDYSKTLFGETADDRADMERKLDVGTDAENEFLKSNPTGPTKYSSVDHDVLYHLTDRHQFSLDPDHAPQDNTFAIQDRSGRKGLYGVTDRWHVNAWRGRGYQRPYVAEVHVPKGHLQDERWGNEKFLPAEHYDKAKVHRVMTIDQHNAETYEGAEPGGKDVRDFTPEEHTQHLKSLRDTLHEDHNWGWNEFNDQHEHVGTDEEDDEGMPVRRDRKGNVMTMDRYSKRESTVTANRKVAHDSGDGMTIYHCPFCGSGQVIARSDRTIECSFCHIAFTVQVQPVYAQFPQTVDGQPLQVPGMPGQAGVDPMMGADPNAPMDPSQIGPDGNPLDPEQDADGMDAGPEGEEDDDESEDGPDGPPWAKKSYRTAKGHDLPGTEYARHIAILFAENPREAARVVGETR